jgi:hypothetical protein
MLFQELSFFLLCLLMALYVWETYL